MARIGIAGVTVIVAGMLGAACAGLPAFDDAGDILRVDPEERVQAAPPSEDVAMALDRFTHLEMANPDDVGYTWIDPDTRELVLSAATDAGREILVSAADEVGLPYRIRDVRFSYAELERIKDDATRLVEEGLPDADLIFQTTPDHRDNRAMITISEMSQPLLEALARRFPPDALAIQVDPSGRLRDPRPDP